MSTLLIAVLALAASPIVASDSQATAGVTASEAAAPAETLRTGKELEAAVRAALQHWTRPADKELETAANELLGLYRELHEDKVMARSLREDLRQKVRSRLLTVAQQVTKRRAQEAYQAKRAPRTVGAKSVNVAANDKVLGQMGGAMGGNAGMAMGGGGAAGAQGNAALPDAGEDLVQLIQTTVAPKTWDVNGGVGTIYYWKQQRSIVARATQEVHHEISDVLEQLDRASH